MRAVIFYLTTFGYIDGDFDDAEKAFVREYVKKLVAHRIDTSVPASETALRAELGEKYNKHFLEVFEHIDHQVLELFTEAVAENENQDQFVHAKLKLRCFEIFKSFDESSQEALMSTIDELIHADGEVHPAEVKFRGELAQLLEDDLDVELLDAETERSQVSVSNPQPVDVSKENHPFFDQFEYHYSKQPAKLQKQIEADRDLLDKVLSALDSQRKRGNGRLVGKQNVSEFAGKPPFLDGHVYVLPPAPGVAYELTVLGDLHGCYSCLKAALMQSEFFDKVAAYKQDPKNNPNPKLVLLGDYIDRGMFSYHGVLRTALQVFATAPDHVYMLRGNHEYYFEHKGTVYGGVKPAEAINTLKPHVPMDVFQHYMKLFDSMPNMLLFDKKLFVHGGIPRDSLIKERYKDMSSLNDEDIRFQMMWSDPSSADVIPASLQEQSARFPLGASNARRFFSASAPTRSSVDTKKRTLASVVYTTTRISC